MADDAETARRIQPLKDARPAAGDRRLRHRLLVARPTCGGSRSTCSRSTGRSSPVSPTTRRTTPSPGRSSRWRDSLDLRSVAEGVETAEQLAPCAPRLRRGAGLLLQPARARRRACSRSSAGDGRCLRPDASAGRLAAPGTGNRPACRACAASTARPPGSPVAGPAVASATSTPPDGRVTDDEVIARIESLVDPAGLDRRLDLPVPQRPHPGDRRRRRRAPPVPLPRRVARRRDAREVRPHARVRPARCPAARERVGERPRASGLNPRRVLACARAAARPRVLPDRHRAVRRARTDLRPGHDPSGARHARPRRDRHVRLRRQERSGAVQAMADPAVVTVVGALKRRRGGGAELLAYRTGGGWRDVRSTDINDYIREVSAARLTAKDFRTWNATVLAAVALAVSDRRADDGDRAQARRDRARSRRSRTTSATRPAVCRASYIDPRVIDLVRRRRDHQAGTDADRRRRGVRPDGDAGRDRARRPADAGHSAGAAAKRASDRLRELGNRVT